MMKDLFISNIVDLLNISESFFLKWLIALSYY